MELRSCASARESERSESALTREKVARAKKMSERGIEALFPEKSERKREKERQGDRKLRRGGDREKE